MRDTAGSNQSTPGDAAPERVRLWDPLTRLFHWLLAAAVTASLLLGHFGPAVMTLHFYSGYLIAGLLAFRIVWGVVGPPPVRFWNVIAGPKTVLAYLTHVFQRRPSHWPGHNPLGGWAVIAMLLVLTGQVATGLVTDPEDYINVGPLAHLVSTETRYTANAWHELFSDILLGLIALHVAAIAFYRLWKREDLIGPMIHGKKDVVRRR